MSNESKVGLLVVAVLVIFVVTFLMVANVQLTGEKVTYRTFFAYIGGLDEGNVVRYGGRKAGTITAVRPWAEDMTKTEVVFEMRAEVPVNRESVATIASLSALSQNYLEVTPGSIGAPRIEPGGTVASTEALTFSDLTRKAARVADEAAELMTRIDAKMTLVADDIHALMLNLQEVTGEQNQRNITRMLENSNNLLEVQAPKIDQITTQISGVLERVEVLTEDFRRVARNADRSVVNVNRTIEETREPIQRNLAELESTLQDAQQLLKDARALLLVNESNIAEVVENFRVASENIEALSSELRQRPWTILRVSPKPDRQVPATSNVPAPSR